MDLVVLVCLKWIEIGNVVIGLLALLTYKYKYANFVVVKENVIIENLQSKYAILM